MVLRDVELSEWAALGGVEPYDPYLVNPASIDLRLSGLLKKAQWYWNPITSLIAHKRDLPRWTKPFEFDSYLLKPKEIVLCSTLEHITLPNDCSALLLSKSSTGRAGIQLLHVGYGDPAFSGQFTFELVNCAPWPVIIRVEQKLVQLQLTKMTSVPQRTYQTTGRYNNQTGPTESRNKEIK